MAYSYTAIVQRDNLLENYGMRQHRIFGESRLDRTPKVPLYIITRHLDVMFTNVIQAGRLGRQHSN
jgi:hypothetical protein